MALLKVDLIAAYKQSLAVVCEDKQDELLRQAASATAFSTLSTHHLQRPLVTRELALRLAHLLDGNVKFAAALLCHLDPTACKDTAAARQRALNS